MNFHQLIDEKMYRVWAAFLQIGSSLAGFFTRIPSLHRSFELSLTPPYTTSMVRPQSNKGIESVHHRSEKYSWFTAARRQRQLELPPTPATLGDWGYTTNGTCDVTSNESLRDTLRMFHNRRLSIKLILRRIKREENQ